MRPGDDPPWELWVAHHPERRRRFLIEMLPRVWKHRARMTPRHRERIESMAREAYRLRELRLRMLPLIHRRRHP